jgi:hypothetical protein
LSVRVHEKRNVTEHGRILEDLMKRSALCIVLIIGMLALALSGCKKIDEMLGDVMEEGEAPSIAIPGVTDPEDEGRPEESTIPIIPGFTSPYAYGSPEELTCCVITNFKAGIITESNFGSVEVIETGTIPYSPGTTFGVYFEYESTSGAPIQYFEEEFFPSPPHIWEMWEGSTGSYQTYPEENRAVYTEILSPDSNKFISTWGLNPAGDPLGEWTWDIYFDGEYFTTVVFNIVAGQ